MKKRLVVILSIIVLAIGVNAQQKVIIDISEKDDATVAVYDALRKVNFRNAIIVFPKGTYNFYPQNAVGKYHPVTNHDNFYTHFGFPLINCKNITIDGGGSEFIFHEVMMPFLIEKSEDTQLENFSIDWEEPFYLQAKVLKSDPEKNTIDIEVNPMTPHGLEASRLYFKPNGFYHPFLGNNLPFDPVTKAASYKAYDYPLKSNSTKETTYESLGGNKYRVKSSFEKRPAPEGMLYVAKGPQTMNRLSPGIHIIDSKNTHLNNINIYHAPGMGVIGEKSENIHLDKVDIKLREGTERIVSTTADATHFCNCRGYLIVENCLMENMYDDGINVHGTFLKVDKIIDGKTILARLNHFQQYGFVAFGAGDSIAFITKSTLMPMAYTVVENVVHINSQLQEIRFKDNIPDNLKINDGIDNISWYPEFTFRNNIVRNNRARSVLASTRKRILIEKNTFSSMSLAILFEGDMKSWYESGPVHEVLVRENQFLDCLYGGSKTAVISVNPRMDEMPDNIYFEKNIVIENNIFKTFDNAILRARSVDKLVFRNNQIIETYTYPKIFPDLPTIDINHSKNVEIKSNTYEGKQKATIKLSKSSRNGLNIDKKQKGFLLDF